MANIFLPAEEDTQVVINIKGKPSVSIDIFDLEDIFVRSQAKSDEMGTTWREEFPRLFENKTKKPITSAQATLLWDGVKSRIYELKKSLLAESENSVRPESPSRRKMKKKSG